MIKKFIKRFKIKNVQIKYSLMLSLAMVVLLGISQFYTNRTIKTVLPNILSTEIGNQIRALQAQLFIIGIIYILLIAAVSIYVAYTITKLNFLIVDDDKVIRETMKLFLKNRYPTAIIYEADNGFTAGEILGTVGIHLVTLDIMMPGMDGFDVMKQLKEDPQLGSPEVIVVTGYTEEDLEDRVREYGASGLILKPFDMNILIEKIEDIIGG
ncbi:response regulator [Elusimicrobiota bacterium]